MTDKPAETMLERCAKVLHEKFMDDPSLTEWGKLDAAGVEFWKGLAKAALEAILEVLPPNNDEWFEGDLGREPRWGMRWDPIGNCQARGVMIAVISAILSEEA